MGSDGVMGQIGSALNSSRLILNHTNIINLFINIVLNNNNNIVLYCIEDSMLIS